MFRVPNVDESFDKNGNPAGKHTFAKTTAGFIKELFWCIEAKSRMKDFK
jgi:hypothetical protein